MRTPFYLVVWAKPRVRSGRAADRLVHQAAQDRGRTFEESPSLDALLAWLSQDARIGIDDTLSIPRNRMLTLTIPWDALDELGRQVAGQCEERHLVLFDPQHGRLVVPEQPGAAPWPIRERAEIALLRETVDPLEMTGDPEEDVRRLIDAVRQSFGGSVEVVRGTRDIPER